MLLDFFSPTVSSAFRQLTFVIAPNYLFFRPTAEFFLVNCLFLCQVLEYFFGQLFGLVGDTGDAGLDGVEVAEVTALERRNGVLVRDNLKVIVELVHQGHACMQRCWVHAKGGERARQHEIERAKKTGEKERRLLAAPV